MKYITVLLLFFFVNAGAQADLQFLKVKNPDRSVDLSVINHSAAEYKVQVNIDLEGMQFSKELPFNLTIAAKETKVIGKLTPTGNTPTKYAISYKTANLESPSYQYVPNITIYTKNKQKRSTQLLIFLEEKGIAYNEINVSYNGDTKEMYNNMLKRRGIDKKDARLPVIIYKGEVFSDIKRVPKWCKTYLADAGRYIKKKDRKY